MNYHEQSRKIIEEVVQRLSKLPELQHAIDVLRTNYNDELGEEPLRYIVRMYIDYLKIIRHLALLSPEERTVIERVNQETAGDSTKQVSRGGAEVFVDTLGPERLQTLLMNIIKVSDIASETFQRAIIDLTTRMTEGHELAEANETIHDGVSEKADHAIWGHTKGLQTEAMVHFVINHFLNRLFVSLFANDNDPQIQDLIAHKDCLITPLGDVIYLENAQDKASPEIVGIWRRLRTEGGLKWNKEDKQAMYDQVVGHEERGPMYPYTLIIPSALQKDFRRLVKHYLWEARVIAIEGEEASPGSADFKVKVKKGSVGMELQHPTGGDSMKKHMEFQAEWMKIVEAYTTQNKLA
ncbi:MAG: hypothetical protein HZA34_02500 [Candidatus Pacebacteria bacterium]|nr:hypothetical protein [Candidatus Paceibacterota bacterium]